MPLVDRQPLLHFSAIAICYASHLDCLFLVFHRLFEVARFGERSRQGIDVLPLLPVRQLARIRGSLNGFLAVAHAGDGAGGAQPCHIVVGPRIPRPMGLGLLNVAPVHYYDGVGKAEPAESMRSFGLRLSGSHPVT